jgi:hypothetical protein
MTTTPPTPTEPEERVDDQFSAEDERVLSEPAPAQSRANRDELLRSLRAVRMQLQETGADLDLRQFEGDEQVAIEAEEGALHAIVGQLLENYAAAVPRVPVSRCPFSGDVVWRSVDLAGLDGPWWEYDGVVRPIDRLPATHFAFTGALALAADVEDVDELRKPGPGAPFVLPRLLVHDAITAVLSALPVGQHRGYVIYYFAEQPPNGALRANDWGADRHWFDDGVHWDQIFDDADAYDYDLAPWIERGRLRWIHPSDSELELRRGLNGCPFLDLDGPRHPQRLEAGEVW